MKATDSQPSATTNRTGSLAVLFVLIALMVAVLVRPSPARATTSATGSALNQIAPLQRSLQQSIALETKNLGRWKKLLEEARHLQEKQRGQLKDLEVQLSLLNNLLISTTAGLQDLKKAQSTQIITLKRIETELSRVKNKLQASRKELLHAEDQLRGQDQQLQQVSQLQIGPQLKAQLNSLLERQARLLSRKHALLKEAVAIYSQLAERWETLRTDFQDVGKELNRTLIVRQRGALFERKQSPLIHLSREQIDAEWADLQEQVSRLLSHSFWVQRLSAVWQAGRFLLISSLVLFAILELLLLRICLFCRRIDLRRYGEDHPWQVTTFELFHRHLPLLGATALTAFAAQAYQLYEAFPLIRFLTITLVVWLYTSWAKYFIQLCGQRLPSCLDKSLHSLLLRLFDGIRVVAVVYVLLYEVFASGPVLLFFVRFAAEVAFTLWSFHFWRRYREVFQVAAPGTGSNIRQLLHNLLIYWGYGVALIGLGLELAGYGSFTTYWYVSWLQTAIVALWLIPTYLSLREWERDLHRIRASSPSEIADQAVKRPLRWILIKAGWLGWAIAGITLLFLAWGSKKTVIVGFFRLFYYPIPIGNIRFRLIGIAYAVLVLAVTQAATRFWSQLLRKRVLADSGLGIGVQESIITISVYALWLFGILAALNTLGVSSGSLAVAFGALGIGLGFGLQNIFNNFVSGLILLLERPIQVGDTIEVNGVWGKITKINVRSTVVQTRDNASQIIPNSEFVSNQVINWTFKDARLRRKIDVGVAYGSDVELVRDTLLEIAAANPAVLKYPKPQVLFMDFADSALLFQLRFWTMVQNMRQTETEVRFEIDRLFRERKIEIPFPQQDIHIISTPTGSPAKAEETSS